MDRLNPGFVNRPRIPIPVYTLPIPVLEPTPLSLGWSQSTVASFNRLDATANPQLSYGSKSSFVISLDLGRGLG